MVQMMIQEPSAFGNEGSKEEGRKDRFYLCFQLKRQPTNREGTRLPVLDLRLTRNCLPIWLGREAMQSKYVFKGPADQEFETGVHDEQRKKKEVQHILHVGFNNLQDYPSHDHAWNKLFPGVHESVLTWLAIFTNGTLESHSMCKKVTNLTSEEVFAFNVSLRMFTQKSCSNPEACGRLFNWVLKLTEKLTSEADTFNTSAGNPVKKILLKLNLSDHRLCKMVVECQSVKVKEFQERCNIKAFQEWYEHVGPEVASPQGGKVTRWRRDYAWLMISRCSRSLCQIQVQGTSSNQEVNDHYNIFTRESQEYELKTKDKA
ncbi:hypothetical protein Tco_0373965 [Tanacetum coccineum]